MKHHVFISYSRKDTASMRQVKESLIAEGLTVWTDETLTPGTQSWKMAIEDAIENAGCFVVLMSPDAKESQWVGRELDYASAQGLRIFPVLVRGSERSAIPLTLISTQFSDIRQNDHQSLEALLNSICQHLGIPRAQPRVDHPIPHGAFPVPRRRSMGLIAILAVLTLLVFIVITALILPGLRTVDPTLTPSLPPQASSSPPAATAITLVAGGTATPTPRPSANSARVLGPGCDPLVEEEFSGGVSTQRWFIGIAEGSIIQMRDDFYEIEILGNNPGADAVSWGSLQELRFSDARVEAVVSSAHFAEADESRTGLWLRYQDENNFLAFMISSSGRVRIARYERGYTDLLPWTPMAAVRTGDRAANTLRIDSSGSVFDFYVNGELTATAEDETWADGRIAFWGATNLAENQFFLDYLRVCPN